MDGPQLIGGSELVVLPGLYWCFWFWPSLWLNWAGCCTSGNLTNQRVIFNFDYPMSVLNTFLG
jgi:hypothetical protein